MIATTYRQLAYAMRRQATADPHYRYVPRRMKAGSAMRGFSMDCHYLPDEHNPKGCLVGAALVELGTPPEALVPYDEDPLSDLVVAGIIDIELDDALYREWVLAAQEAQDWGYEWSDAIAKADAEIPMKWGEEAE